MFLSKKARSWQAFSLAIVAMAAGILGLIWLGADAAEAAGRNVPLTRNEITTPSAATTTAFAANIGNAPCLQSFAEWEPLGSRVEVEFILMRRTGEPNHWKPIDSSIQPLPGKANSASVDWGIVAPGFEYRHWFQLYTVKGRDGASRNHQLISEMSNAIPVTTSCGG